MKCKYCQAELEEGVSLCPACGKEQETEPEAEMPTEVPAEEAVAEETPAAEAAVPEIKEGIKATPGMIALAIAAGVVVLALLVAIVVSGIDGDVFKNEETVSPTEYATEPAETVPEGTIPPDGNPDDVTCKGSYSVSDDDIYASMDTVVATVGDKELTIGQLQIYFWESFYAFDSEWGSYAIQLGLDVTRGMDTQLCQIGDISMTWQQYFLDYALNTWHTHQAMALAGKDAGYVLSDELQTEMDNMPGQIDEMVAYYGLTDGDQWIRNYIGPGCTVDDYIDYMSTYYHGYGYLEHLEQTTKVTADEVEAYFAENEEIFTSSGVTKDSGKVVDVRHILLMPENGTTGEDGYPVYSEEDWAACQKEAQELYDKWLAGDMTEDSFSDFAKEYSVDGSASMGGLYENVTQGYMVETFDAWCFDETRKPGDHGLVKTQYGYHIMYFVDSQELWYAAAEAELISEKISAAMPAAREKYPITVDYSAIKLGIVDFNS